MPTDTARPVEPFAARACPALPTTITPALQEVVTAVNGFAYDGDRLDAIVDTVRWLRESPGTARTLLGLTDQAAAGEALAMKCAFCHLFVVANPAYEDDPENYARWDHCDRGDDADEAITGTHEAQPSSMAATLDTWQRYGPVAMRLRFGSTGNDLVGLYILTARRVADAGHDTDATLGTASYMLRVQGVGVADSVTGLDLVQRAGSRLGGNPDSDSVARFREALHVLGADPKNRLALIADMYAALNPKERARTINRVRGFARWADPDGKIRLRDVTDLVNAAYTARYAQSQG